VMSFDVFVLEEPEIILAAVIVAKSITSVVVKKIGSMFRIKLHLVYILDMLTRLSKFLRL
jgi:hypothetical protein